MQHAVALILALLLLLPAFAQTPEDAAANRLFVEAVKARDEVRDEAVKALAAGSSAEADISQLTRFHDLHALIHSNLRSIVDRYPGSALAVRLVLGEEIGGRFSLQGAARDAVEAREQLEVALEEAAARPLLEPLDAALSRARGFQDPGARLAELQLLSTQVAEVDRLLPRARQAASALRALETEISALSAEIEIAAARDLQWEIEPSLARAREIADPSMRLAELQRLRSQIAAIAERHAQAQQTVDVLRALDADVERLAAEIAAVAAAPFKAINEAAGIGRMLRDCQNCPELVVVPAGATRLASGRDVTIAAPFAVGKFEVTFAEWDACVGGGGCTHRALDYGGWDRGLRPVHYVNWHDAQRYVAWLSRKTGKSYRLLSEAEWEYAAQAGIGREQVALAGANQANCAGCGSRWDSKQTAPVGSFAANAFGLHDMLGNVWEWTADCWNESHAGAASDGSARIAGDCLRRVLRGGSWVNDLWSTRSAIRFTLTSDHPNGHIGFRVARSL